MDSVMQKLEEKAKLAPQRIVFPESGERLILEAAQQLVARGIGTPLLVGSPGRIKDLAVQWEIDTQGFAFFDNTDEETRQAFAREYLERLGGLSAKSILRKTKDALQCAMLLVRGGLADACAAGKVYTTGEVIYAAQSLLGLKEGMHAASSLGIVNAPSVQTSEGCLLAIGDCAINAWPDAEDLADIAIASADTVHRLFGWEPRVAMLSFSTCGSAEDESIEAIRRAVEIARERCPGLLIDGEFQLDAAIVPAVASKKVPRPSGVAGKANVLIFPNLHAGNIGVKLIQLFGRADAYGPVLQGFAYPVCDFSRSAPLSEIMGNLLMLVVRAQEKR